MAPSWFERSKVRFCDAREFLKNLTLRGNEKEDEGCSHHDQPTCSTPVTRALGPLKVPAIKSLEYGIAPFRARPAIAYREIK